MPQASTPALPPAAPKPAPTPFKTGDGMLDKGDITSKTPEYIPGFSIRDVQGRPRTNTRREDRDMYQTPQEYRQQADKDIAAGQKRYQSALRKNSRPPANRRAATGRR